MIDIEIDTDPFSQTLSRLMQAVADAGPVMGQIAHIMWDAVEENFKQEGRPHWIGLAPSTLQARVGTELRKSGGIYKSGAWSLKLGQRAAQSGKILQRSGRLAASITPSSDGSSATVGTNVVYAAIQQFGGTTRPHVIEPRFKKALAFGGIFARRVNHPGSKIPARPYLSLTDHDGTMIEEAMANYLRQVTGE